ncbi:hypothetical protein kam1_64 [Methylacidiphilum kamchatkense Kam1]|uniref:Uncharacterized protein n=1 Tax=Methylacidiphilum kamchatkense Kam1 TaxID=1202785 RepID=A0A516TJE0_9BACT|nr:hypothetical protein kam1_64 [Methylacidiphilum kamchatkense Kam1]
MGSLMAERFFSIDRGERPYEPDPDNAGGGKGYALFLCSYLLFGYPLKGGSNNGSKQ